MSAIFGESKHEYTDETFIEIAVDNFSDYVVKSLTSLQSYTNILQFKNPSVYSKIVHCVNHNDEEDAFIHFMMTENENIFCLKATGFAIEITDLVMRKYEMLIRQINYEGKNVTYNMSTEAWKFFNSEIDRINWQKICMEEFFTDKSPEELLHFDQYLEDRYNFYKDKTFKKDDHDIDSERMLYVLDNGFLKITSCMLHLKEIAELTRELTKSFIIIRQILDLIILTYFIMKTIEVKRVYMGNEGT